jgi:flagellar hook-associated protein 3 FlgL
LIPRVTHNMMTNKFMSNLNDIFSRLQKVHDQMTTGRAIQRPSDNPPGATHALSLRSALQLQSQYLRTIDLSKTWLDTNEAALTTMTDVVQRARELAVQASNDTLNGEDRLALGQEAEQLLQSALAAANGSLTGAYLFGGHKTTAQSLGTSPNNQPFTLVGSTLTYNGDDGEMKREIGPGLEITINITANSAGVHPLESVLQSLVDFRDNLIDSTTNSSSTLISQNLGQIDTALSDVVNLRAETGAKINRFEFASERLKDIEFRLTALLSTVQDADTVETATLFAKEQTVYQAALKAGASAIQPSLLDFLR